jgi:hypothetical protein
MNFMNIAGLVLLIVVIAGGVIMAALGGSRDTFMALVLLGAGGMVLIMSFYYRQNPSYTNAEGVAVAVGPAMVMFLGAIGVLLIAGGLFAGIHGFE